VAEEFSTTRQHSTYVETGMVWCGGMWATYKLFVKNSAASETKQEIKKEKIKGS
jgi:hypothetical protein